MVIIILNYDNYNIFPDEIKKKICIENKKEIYIILFLFSELLSLGHVRQERDRLITSVLSPKKVKCFPDNFKQNITADIISIMGTIFYLCVAKDDYYNNSDPTDCSPTHNLIIENLLIIAAFLGLYDTLYEKQRQVLGDSEDFEDNDILTDIGIL